jgi:hypothetical protein
MAIISRRQQLHSRWNSRETLLRDLVEGPAAAVQSGLLAREGLPAGHGYIDVRWLQFNRECDSRFFFASDDRRSRTGEGLVNCLAGIRVVSGRPTHAFDWLLRAVDGFGILIAVFDMPELHYDRLFYLYAGISLFRGIYLTCVALGQQPAKR